MNNKYFVIVYFVLTSVIAPSFIGGIIYLYNFQFITFLITIVLYLIILGFVNFKSKIYKYDI